MSSRPVRRVGLGLHLTRRLAELLGGRITVISKYSKGSTFTLEIGERGSHPLNAALSANGAEDAASPLQGE